VTRTRSLLRSPALHFLLLGGLLFLGHRTLAPRFARSFIAASSADGEALTNDDILYRDAVAAGLDRTNPLVRRRLAMLGEMVASGNIEDAAALEAQARRLGLDRTDLVIHRHLVHAMELALSHLGPSEWPTEAELAAYYEQHKEAYAEPARYRFEQVFFARDRRGTPAEEAAAEALRTLSANGGPSAPASIEGDPFLLGEELTMSVPELARSLGPALSAAIEAAPVGRWFGPVSSAYGEHVVRVVGMTPSQIPPLESVRGRVVHALLAERSAAKLEKRLGERRAAYGG